MKKENSQSLNNFGYIPSENTEIWLESAEESVRFLKQMYEKNEEIFLYASTPHFYVQSILVPSASVNPPDHEDLEQAGINTTETWNIQTAGSGQESRRIYIEPPLNTYKSVIGGEKLIFLREFEHNNLSSIEVSQKLVHALGLYCLEERHAYCRLNNHGDIENIIQFDFEPSDSSEKVRAVTIQVRDLWAYMAASNTSLVVKFDFIRLNPETFPGWCGPEDMIEKGRDIQYRSHIVPKYASYACGHIILHQTKLNKNDLIDKWKLDQNGGVKQYASFKIYDWKNNTEVETSCSPDHIVNYFTYSNLPFEMSPAFFMPEVLHKYKNDREKYKITERDISCRAGWHLESYDINEDGLVHTYIGYLSKLPYSEQLHWASSNVEPKGGISTRAFQAEFLGEISSEDNPLAELKSLVSFLDCAKPKRIWWQQRGVKLIEQILGPAANNVKEWCDEILALDQLVVEGFCSKGLKSTIKKHQSECSKISGSLNLLEVALSPKESAAKELVKPLRELHDLRNSVIAHHDPKRKQNAVNNARKAHCNLRKHFQDLLERVRDSSRQIIMSLDDIE